MNAPLNVSRINPSRRGLLATAAGFGLSLQLLAVPAMAADGELNKKKVIVVVCRGGMDGLSVSPPIGDSEYHGLRGGLAVADALPVDGTFALHPQLTAVHALAKAGEARIVPAVATPDRARSHFEAQDVLETGAAGVYSTSSGWLNRAVETLSAHRKVDAISIGPTAPLLLRGKVQTASWSPGRGVDAEARLPSLLQDLYRNDDLLGPALARGLATETMAKDATAGLQGDGAMMAQGGGKGGGGPGGAQAGREAAKTLGQSLAGFMREPGGPTVAAISLDGFDSHANQAGLLTQRLAYLDAVLDGVHQGLGPEWKNTVVLVATEFGRTARANGTGGTDHGTGSTALILGGALKPGGIVGDWPTLKANALFENRDVAPTMDMRGLFKGVLADHMGVDKAALDVTIFPNSAAARPVANLV
jgi:uncharacterized protein (DUF1501 family)